MIISLKPNEIFVFGSNLAGIHGAGAARQAYEKFGATWGQGEGLSGQSYALPTKDYSIKTLSIKKIKSHVAKFLKVAQTREDLTFLVTCVGCGLAGYRYEDIAPLFFQSKVPPNVVLPEEFTSII